MQQSIVKGEITAAFARDIGSFINVKGLSKKYPEAARDASRAAERGVWELQVPPIKITKKSEKISIGPIVSSGEVVISIYNFGGISIRYNFGLEIELSELHQLACKLHIDEGLRKDAERHASTLLQEIKPYVRDHRLAPLTEEYFIINLQTLSNGPQGEVKNLAEHLLKNEQQILAKVLRGEPEDFSKDQIEDALRYRISYYENDVALIDWRAAVLVGTGFEDVLEVLEFSNLMLQQHGFLKQQIDESLDQVYELCRKMTWYSRLLGGLSPHLLRIGRLMLDAQDQFESINDPLRVLGDQYLSQVYRLAEKRFHLEHLEHTIKEKLSSVRDVHEIMGGRANELLNLILSFAIVALFIYEVIKL